MRFVTTVVFPVPAPAMIRSGPLSWQTAVRCSALSVLISNLTMGEHHSKVKTKNAKEILFFL